MAADRTPNELAKALAVRLEHRATQNGIVRSYGIMPSSRPEDDDLDREAAELLREQAEQLDTLRNAMSTCSGSCHAALAAAGGGVPETTEQGEPA